MGSRHACFLLLVRFRGAYACGAMAGETKGFLGGSMKFNTGTEEGRTGAREQEPILPLRVLVVAELVPRNEFNAGASAPETAIRVDPMQFEDLFGKLRPRIFVEVPSVLAEGRSARVDLSPTSLKSFRPDGLCAEVPLLRSLLDGRLVLDRLRDGSITQDQARSELERLWSGSPFAREVLGLLPAGGGAKAEFSAPAPAAAPDTSVDSLLAMVDMPGPSAVSSTASRPEPAAQPVPVASVQSRFGALIEQVAKAGRTSSKAIQPAEAIARVERALGLQIGAILQHPEVRRLEQAWRGLKLMTERAQGHSGLRVDVLSVRGDQMAEALGKALRTTNDPPYCAAVLDTVVDGSAASFARLEAIADVAERNAVPVVLNASAGLLGVQTLRGIDRLDNKGALFDSPSQVVWRSAVAKPCMRWVTLAMNGALSRGPYDKTTSRMREAVVKEMPDDEAAFVWMPPAYLIGSLIVKSFRDTNWPQRIAGIKNGGVIENLPVREIKSSYEGDEGVAIPTEAYISTDSQRELSRLGVLVIAAAPNTDQGLVLHAPTAYVPPPKRTYDSATQEPEIRLEKVTLIDQLFVARVIQFLHALCSKFPSASEPSEVEPVLKAAMWALFENAPTGIEIDVKARARDEGTVVSISIRPRRFLGVTLEEFSLDMPLG